MIPRRLSPFLSQVEQHTDDGTLKWRQSTDDSFYCSHRDSDFFFDRCFDEERETEFFSFYVKQRQDVVAEFQVYRYEENEYDRMRNLFSLVRLNAKDAVSLLNNLFENA